ncbi:MAG: PD40 domain-containing protein, partial [Pseudomonadales bacterium]|nr:PD40 domain-containing protein [Pseudomonadales bacterium]
MRFATSLITAILLSTTAAAKEPELHWISNGANNRDLTISPDGNVMMTTIMWPGNHFSVIVMSEKKEGVWQDLMVAPFSGTWPDIEPMFSPDGGRLFFASKRPAPDKPEPDWDIWVTERNDQGWG